MVRRTFPGAGVVVIIAVLAACAGDRPAVTAPGMEESSARERPLEPVPELPVVSVVEGYLDLPVSERFRTIAVPFPGADQIGMCHTQIAKVQRPVPFLLERMEVEFPAEAWDEAGGESTYFVYRWRSSTGRLLEAARCRIPRSGLALEHITAQFRDVGLAWRQERRRTAQAVRVTGMSEGWTLVLGADSAPVASTLFGAPVAMTEGGEDPCVLDPSPENPCELDGIEPTVCQNPDMEYDPELDECFCGEDKLKDPDLNECYCENGSEEEDCWLDPGDINDPPGDPPGGGGGGGTPPGECDPADEPCDEPGISVECAPLTLERGEPITCSAEVLDAGTDVFWTFVSGPGATRPLPVVTFAGTQWSGPMVIGGEIQVQVSGDHVSQADTFLINVTDRSWGFPVEGSPPPGGLLGRGDEPVVDSVNADGSFYSIRFGLNISVTNAESYVPEGVGDYQTAVVPSGPNQGIAYVQAHNYSMTRTYWVNQWLKSSWQQRKLLIEGQMYNSFEAELAHYGGDPDLLIASIGAHEWTGANSHQARLVHSVTGPGGCGNLAAYIERVISTPDGISDDAWLAEFTGGQWLLYEAGHNFVFGYLEGHMVARQANTDQPFRHAPTDGQVPNAPPADPCIPGAE